MSIVNALLKATKSEFISSVEDGIPNGYNPDEPFFDTGSYSFNALLTGSIYGGFTPNKITTLAGESTTGKTWYLLSCILAFQKTYPDGMVFLFESESALTAEMFTNYGINPKLVFVSEVNTVQDFRQQCTGLIMKYTQMKKALKKGETLPKLLVGLDSLGNLSTNKELEDIEMAKDVRDMTRAQLVRGTFRALTIKLGRAGITTIITNHTYASMSMFSGKSMSGGDGILYASSTVIFFGKQAVKTGKEKIGNVIHCTLKKGRFTVEGKSVETKLFFGRGLDRYWGLLPIAAKYGLVATDPSSTKKFHFPDAGGNFKNGKSWINPAHTEQWYCDPSRVAEWFTDDFLRRVDQACHQEFLYGSAQNNIETEAKHDEPVEEAE